MALSKRGIDGLKLIDFLFVYYRENFVRSALLDGISCLSRPHETQNRPIRFKF